MEKEKGKDLIKKLKALSERGEGGERMNADKILKQTMKKYGITEEDFDDERISAEIFTFKSNQRRIMVQSILVVMGKSVQIYGYKGKRNAYIIDCTKSQLIEIKAIFDFYWREFEKDMELFTKAFIYKNRLIPYDAGSISLEELSLEELKEQRKIQEMMSGLEKKQFRKQIENK